MISPEKKVYTSIVERASRELNIPQEKVEKIRNVDVPLYNKNIDGLIFSFCLEGKDLVNEESDCFCIKICLKDVDPDSPLESSLYKVALKNLVKPSQFNSPEEINDFISSKDFKEKGLERVLEIQKALYKHLYRITLGASYQLIKIHDVDRTLEIKSFSLTDKSGNEVEKLI